MSPSRRWWAERGAADFERIDPSRTIALVPVAAVEQHGPHLPLGTDAIIAEGMLRTLIDFAPSDLDLRILPVQAVGKSNEHLHALGTLTLSAPVLIEAWTELGLSVARTGIAKIVFVTSHGGNEEVTGIVARELRVRARMLAVRSSWGRFGTPPGLIAEKEERLGIHGGEIETALMLHFRPDLVDRDRAADFTSSFSSAERDFDLLRPTGPFGYAWIASDLNPRGVVGDASRASAETGRLIAEHQARGLLRLLADMEKAAPFDR